MAIQDDISIDYVNQIIDYTTAFVDDRPPTIYTVNELYSYLQDTFDEPAQMDDLVPMSAQTPTQYSWINQWYGTTTLHKALYGGSLQTADQTHTGSVGVTQLHYTAATSEPTSVDVGKAVTAAGSGATGIILEVDTARDPAGSAGVVWVRNTSATQFAAADVIDDDATGLDPDFTVGAASTQAVLSGETVYTNIFSTGPIRDNTEVYIGQEDDFQGGTAFADTDADSRFERRMEKIDEWWDSAVDFSATPNDLGAESSHVDLLIRTQEAGVAIDGQRLAVFARQHGQVFSHFEIIGGAKNSVIAFAANAADLNAADGPYNVSFDAKAGGNFAIGDLIQNDTGTTPVGRNRAVITGGGDLVSAAGDFDYYLVGDQEAANGTLIQFADNDNIRESTATVTADIAGTATLQNGALANPGAGAVTITFADTQVDVDEDTVNEEYSCTIDCANNPLSDVYKRVHFLTCRGNQDGTVADTQDTLLPSGQATGEAGEFYRGIGDVVFLYDTGQGTQPTEGDLVTNGTGAYGVVTSITAGTTGTCVLTQVKGTWADGDTVAEIDAAASNDVTVNGSVTTISDNTGSPFGTFAGGRWFLAQGVVLTNVPAADANNWEAIDLTGAQRVPPTQRVLTLAGMVVNDRGLLAEVTAAGGTTLVKNHEIMGGAAAISDVTLTLATGVDNDVPTSGFLRVVDDSLSSTGVEYRYEYSSISGTTVTLRAVSPDPGTCTSVGTSTVLNDTGQFATFGTDGEVKVGHEIRNITTGGIATVLRKIDNNSIETTPLSSGIWGNTDTYEVNQVVVALTTSDNVYFPFIDDVVESGTSLSTTIKFVGTTECIARARFSDPDVGGTRILPFELKNVQVTDADLTVTAIRNTDTIAT